MRLNNSRKLKILPVLTAAIILLGGCAAKAPPEPVSETRLLLDTVCTVTVYGTDDASLPASALDLCAEYEALLTRTRDGSDIWRINHAQGAPVTVDPRTAELLQTALGYSDFSSGGFDITVGQLCALWDFGGNPAVPSDSALAAARDTVDYRLVTVTGDTVQLGNADTWLDLGSIAKGYIADKLAEFLKERGVHGAVVNLGGNIVVVGSKPEGGPWHVGITQPFAERSKLIGALGTGEASIVTSGIYERKFVEDGVLYHHILDPATGKPAISDVVSATIVTGSSTAGDALSTVVILAGSANAEAALRRDPDFIGAVLMLENGELMQIGDIDFQPVD